MGDEMTNKQERYYVVSESDLKDLIFGARWADRQYYTHAPGASDLDKAEAACRAREVSYVSTEFSDDSDCNIVLWKQEVKE